MSKMRLPYPRTTKGWLMTVVISIIAVISPVFWFVHYTSSSPSICKECHPDMALLWRQSKKHPSSVHCVECHQSVSQTMNAGQEVINPNCIDCHRDTLYQVSDVKPTKPIRMSHRYHLEEGLSCTDCHINLAHDQDRPGTNRPLKARCFTCHMREMGWGEWRGTCFRCHYIDLTVSYIMVKGAR